MHTRDFEFDHHNESYLPIYLSSFSILFLTMDQNRYGISIQLGFKRWRLSSSGGNPSILLHNIQAIIFNYKHVKQREQSVPTPVPSTLRHQIHSIIQEVGICQDPSSKVHPNSLTWSNIWIRYIDLTKLHVSEIYIPLDNRPLYSFLRESYSCLGLWSVVPSRLSQYQKRHLTGINDFIPKRMSLLSLTTVDS